MSEHIAEIIWKRTSDSFAYDHYNRAHLWRFDGGVEVPGSAAPAYRGEPNRVDPEEAFRLAFKLPHADLSRHRCEKAPRGRRL